MNAPWMIDELAHAGPEHLDPAFVAGYDVKQGHPDPAEDLAALLAHGLDRTSTIVIWVQGRGSSRWQLPLTLVGSLPSISIHNPD
jgi:hypothetical protein